MNQLFVKAVVNLFAKISDINVNDVRAALIIVIPDMVLDFFSAENDTVIDGEILQKLIFLRRKRNIPAASRDLSA